MTRRSAALLRSLDHATSHPARTKLGDPYPRRGCVPFLRAGGRMEIPKYHPFRPANAPESAEATPARKFWPAWARPPQRCVIPYQFPSGTTVRLKSSLMHCSRTVSASELLEHTIARIEALDRHLNAVVVRDFERAREAA